MVAKSVPSDKVNQVENKKRRLERIEFFLNTLRPVPKMQLSLKGPVSQSKKVANENDISKNEGEASEIEEQIAALRELNRKAKKIDYAYNLHVYGTNFPKSREKFLQIFDPQPDSAIKADDRNWYIQYKSAEDGLAVKSFINGPEGRRFRGKAYKVHPWEPFRYDGWAIRVEISSGTTEEHLTETFKGILYRLCFL